MIEKGRKFCVAFGGERERSTGCDTNPHRGMREMSVIAGRRKPLRPHHCLRHRFRPGPRGCMPRVGPSAGALTLVMAVVKEDRVLFEGYIK
jgi:hypothetical protein